MLVADGHPLSRDHQVLREAMGEAGELAKSLFERGVETWEKADKTPVTEADLAVDTLLRERLAEACPDYGWLSEETQENPARRSFKRVWIVDPIDGTKGFVRGTDQWCISAALVEDGLPLLGILVNPVRGEIFEAARGAGAYCNGSKLAASVPGDVPGCHLIMHTSILKSKKWAKPWPDINLSMQTSMALRLCRVATGEADGTVVISGKSDWDLAAADLLVQEAGGRVTDLVGASMRYNGPETRHHGIVGAGMRFHDQLLDHTRGWKRNF